MMRVVAFLCVLLLAGPALSQTLYVSEYSSLARDASGLLVPMPSEPSVAEQTVSIADTSTQSSAFDSETRFVMLQSDTDCFIAFGSNPTALQTEKLLKAGVIMFFGVTPGHKVAVIEPAA